MADLHESREQYFQSGQVVLPGRPALAVTAIYAGSFDPFTLGHQDILSRAAEKFSDVIVAIGMDAKKSPWFTLEERQALIEQEISCLPEELRARIRVESFSGLLAHYALSRGAKVLIRGVRGITDIPLESQYASINREQTGFEDLDTVFFPARQQYENVSSSATKELLGLGGDVRNYVSRNVEEAMRRILRERRGETQEPVAGYFADLTADRAERIVSAHWHDLCSRLRVSDGLARSLGREIVNCYRASERHHHDLIHIAEGLQMMDRFRDQIAALDAFELAWMLHDSDYDPGAPEKGANEKASVARLRRIATEARIPPGVSSRAAQFIEGTISHRTYRGDQDGALFIDLDLSILGSAPGRYDRYCRDIREEYSLHDDQTFNAGRLGFLRSLEKRERIFRTEFFGTLFETQAMNNMQREIEKTVWGSVLAVTGSIGSGKTTVMQLLAERGFLCASADSFAREALEPGTETFNAVVAHFGAGILDGDGKVDRKLLGRLVFSDPNQRSALEKILHPDIQSRALRFFAQAIEEKQSRLAYEVPLLFEAGLERRGFGKILLVTADEGVRMQRVVSRDGISSEEAARRIAAQMPDTEKIKHSDLVLDNSTDIESLRRQLENSGF